MKALIVEDDLALSDVLAFTLRRAGFEVVAVHDGLDGLDAWRREEPDVILLDLNLPGLDGLAVCRRIRAGSQTPIIILTVRGEEAEVVQGLELGADDYIVKPFSPRELVARVRAVLRRAGQTPGSGTLSAAGLTLDRSRNEVHRAGEDPIRLTPLETSLLETLMLNAGRVLTGDALLDAVWGAEGGDRAMLKQLVYRLRAKIEPDPATPTYVETVPGVGYGFIDDNA
ncbi:MAG TPA: response regulator transcription factor [Candidatus Sulfomarinibacteraceae bacterium]|nr:response regulator transcription factor [Candidatus Sulfomarinibacteraceae bacterium]